ncbi:MAG: FliH/SctL family protein [Planctomycetota bacterium]
MPIVKQHTAKPLTRDAVVLDLGDLGKQAAKLRAASEAKARQILADARDEAQRIIGAAEKQGHERGHAAGLAQGLEEGRAQGHAEALAAGTTQVKQVTDRFSAVAREWDEQRDHLGRDGRSALLEFALSFARKLTHRVIATDPQVVVEQVGEALARVLEPTDVTIRIHPEDRPVLQDVLPDLLAGMANLQHVTLLDDDAVGRGGCVLGLRGGEVDASIDTQMRRIAELLVPGRVEPEQAAAAADIQAPPAVDPPADSSPDDAPSPE